MVTGSEVIVRARSASAPNSTSCARAHPPAPARTDGNTCTPAGEARRSPDMSTSTRPASASAFDNERVSSSGEGGDNSPDTANTHLSARRLDR